MSKMRKIIFLDIDGVLATNKCVKMGLWSLCDDKQKLLGEILDKTGAELVISSSWRKHTLEDTIEYFKKEGFWFCDKIVGITIRGYHYLDRTQEIHLSIPRGVEIKQWVDTHIHSDNGKDYKRLELGVDWNYLILDDAVDMLLEHRKNFVNTNCFIGLTKPKVKRSIKILNQTENK